MTKKHFNALAHALHTIKPSPYADGPTDGCPDAYFQWENDCRAVADVCSRMNPMFSRSRFLDACLKGVN